MTQTILPRERVGAAPLSYAQELLWHLDHASPGMTAYNVPRAIRIRGALDVEALRRALDTVVDRHEILRTTYEPRDGATVQLVQPHRPFVLPVVDLRGEAEPLVAAERLVHDEARTPFDFARDLFLRAKLLRTADDEYTLVLVSHHIASDGWSRGLLFDEISAAYDAFSEGVPLALTPLPLQYADFAAWQRDTARTAAAEEQLAYWRQQLADVSSLQLPTTFARPRAPSFDGSRVVTVLPAPLLERVRRFASDRGATLYMVLLAAYQTLLHRYTGQDDVIVGSPVATRDLPETEYLIGYFANTLAMRASFAGDPSFEELLQQVVDTAIDAFEHADVPFERLVLDLRPSGASTSDAPLVQAVLTMEDTLPAALRLGDAEVTPYSIDYGQAKFDLTLLVAEQPDGLRLALWYRTDLFDAGFAEAALAHLRTLLERVVAQPDLPVSQLPILSDGERATLARLASGPELAWPTRTVHARIVEQARRTPDAPAVRCGDDMLSYAQLDAGSNQLARHLQTLGVKAGAYVGLCEDRSVAAIVGLLGILKAGGAYVALSPELPQGRLARQVAESSIEVIVCTSANRAAVEGLARTIVALDRDAESLARYSPHDAVDAASPDGDAYVLFTSGSTGVPKGVAVTHRNIAAYTAAITARLELAADDALAFGMVSTLSADLGNTVLYAALTTGGTLHVIPPDVAMDAARFGEYVARQPLDVLKITPSHMQALLSGPSGDAIVPRRWIVFGGEPLPAAFAEQLAAVTNARVLNHYGPTEATVGCCTFEVVRGGGIATPSGTVPIGRPLAGARAIVVDRSGGAVPIGIPGELWIGGAGIARGYVGHPEWTAERFAADPFSADAGARVYRSGDRVRWLESGDLEFLGRMDQQIKIRGYRVELGEIEAALERHPAVQRAVVTLWERAPGDTQLVAHVQGDATPAELLELAAAQLPGYMIPAAIVPVVEWPLTRNGKIDRAALAAPAQSDAAPTVVMPRSDTERRLARIWGEVLKRDDVGVTRSFADLGGHSLLAIRVLGRVSKEFGVRLPLRTLFDAPTVEQMARIIDAELGPTAEDDALRDALAAVAELSEAEVANLLATDRAGQP